MRKTMKKKWGFYPLIDPSLEFDEKNPVFIPFIKAVEKSGSAKGYIKFIGKNLGWSKERISKEVEKLK